MSNNNDIRVVVKSILRKVFNDDVNTFYDDTNKINIKCPVCGDSHTDYHRKRGYLYLDTMKYKCFNGDCDATYWNVTKFIKHFDEKIDYKFRQHIIDIQKSNTRKHIVSGSVSKKYIDFLKKHKINIKTLINRYSLIPIEKSKWAFDYIKSRDLSKHQQNLYCKVNKYGYKEVWLVNTYNEDGHEYVIGLQIRMLGYKVKYLTKSFSEIYSFVNYIKKVNLCNELDVSNEFMSIVDNISMIYNLSKCDFTNTVTIFEGAFDSFLIKNSLATSGSSKLKNFFNDFDNIRYLQDNDLTGYKRASNLLKQGDYVFMWCKFINDYKLSKNTIDLNKAYMQNKTCLNNIDKYFTNKWTNKLYIYSDTKRDYIIDERLVSNSKKKVVNGKINLNVNKPKFKLNLKGDIVKKSVESTEKKDYLSTFKIV